MFTSRLPVSSIVSWVRANRARNSLLAAAVFLLLVPIALLIDLPIARFCLADKIPGDIQRVLQWSEVVAHGLGVAIIAGILYVMDSSHRRFLPRLLALAYGAGLLADALKLVVARVRPRHLAMETGVLDTFAGWMPIVYPIEGRSPFDSHWLSFPSGHTAVAIAFAIGLSRIYPRGRYLFMLLALAAAFQRIDSGAHYLSDTLAGAAIGACFALVMTESKSLSAWFDRFECRSGSVQQPSTLLSSLDPR